MKPRRKPIFTAKSSRVRWVAYAVGGGVLSLLITMLSVFSWVSLSDPPPLAKDGLVGIWVEHRWVEDQHDPQDYEVFCAHLNRHHVTDLYMHVGPFSGDGTIPPERYPTAHTFIAEMQSSCPQVRYHAWMGQIDSRYGGPLNISSPAIRTRMIATAEIFLDIGFDGIHYNIEPLVSGDHVILTLLDETRVLTKGRGRLLSIAGDELDPLGHPKILGTLLGRGAGLWNKRDYQEISARVDQIAVMLYDTSIPWAWAFTALVAWETDQLDKATGKGVDLLIGVPTYEDKRMNFSADAENISSSLKGIKLGGQSINRPANQFGIALYANWTTSDEEWAVLRKEWLSDNGPAPSTP